MLAQGGNAIDAAVAAAFAQGVVDPLNCGIGGSAHILIYDGVNDRLVFLDAGAKAGSKASPASYHYSDQPPVLGFFAADGFENYMGYRSVAIPSFVRGLADAHARYGRLPWKVLLEPAIELAAHGFQVYPYLYQFWEPGATQKLGLDGPSVEELLRATPECARIFLKEGRTYRVGQVFKQTDYARTLEHLAHEGAASMYTGALAKAIADDFDKHDGLFTRDDLTRCTTEFHEPHSTPYHDYVFVSDGPPGGGVLMMQALKILEQFDLRSLGWQSPEYYDLLARVLWVMYENRRRYMADPAFAPVSSDSFLAAEAIERSVRELYTSPSLPGQPEKDAASHTTHVSVVDRWGNAIALTHSNGLSSGVVTPGLGFMYNNHLSSFYPGAGHPNSIAAGKKPIYIASPTMLFYQGKLKLVSGSCHRFRMTGELQVLLSMMDFSADAQTAVDQPRIHAGQLEKTIEVEPTFPKLTLSALEHLGWKTQPRSMYSPLCMIALDANQRPHPIIDSRGGGGYAVR